MEIRSLRLLDKANEAIKKGNATSARLSVNKVLRSNPDFESARLTLARILFLEGDMPAGTTLLEQLAQSYTLSQDSTFFNELCAVLEQYELYFPLADVLTLNYSSKPDSTLAAKLGNVKLLTGQISAAQQYFLQAIELGSSDPEIYLSLGHTEKAYSNTQQAAEYYWRYIKLNPAKAGSGFWSLADLKAYKFTTDDIQYIEQATLTDGYQQGLLKLAYHHALAQLGKRDQAKTELVAAKQQLAQYRKFNQSGLEHLTAQIKSSLAHTSVQKPHDTPVPIYIVGLPRSGTTLTEQILTAHSAVKATDELPYLERVALYLSQKGFYPGKLDSMPAELIEKCRQFYVSQANNYDCATSPYFIDKNPNNFIHIGLIRCLFPDAKIVCLSRPVMDNAASLLRQHFSKGNDFAYRPQHILTYMNTYYDLLAFWQQTDSRSIYVLDYQKLVTSPKDNVQQLLKYCELPFEESCLTFYQTTEPVLTPSASQVKQPLNTKSLGQGEWLATLFAGCSPSLEEISVLRDEVLALSNT